MRRKWTVNYVTAKSRRVKIEDTIWREKTNEEVYEDYGQLKFVNIVRTNRPRLLRHEERWAKRIFWELRAEENEEKDHAKIRK